MSENLIEIHDYTYTRDDSLPRVYISVGMFNHTLNFSTLYGVLDDEKLSRLADFVFDLLEEQQEE